MRFLSQNLLGRSHIDRHCYFAFLKSGFGPGQTLNLGVIIAIVVMKIGAVLLIGLNSEFVWICSFFVVGHILKSCCRRKRRSFLNYWRLIIFIIQGEGLEVEVLFF